MHVRANALSKEDETQQERVEDYQETSSQVSVMEDLPADRHQSECLVVPQMQPICKA